MDYFFLDEERKKLWERLAELDAKLEAKLPENEAEVIALLERAQNQLTEINTQADKLAGELAAVDTLKETVVSMASVVKENNELIVSVRDDALASKELLDGFVSKITTVHNEIKLKETFFSEFDKKLNAADKQIEELDGLFQAGTEAASKIDVAQKGIAAKKNDFDKLYIEIFGYLETDAKTGEEKPVQGKRDELEDAYKLLIANFNSHKLSVDSSFEEQKERMNSFESSAINRANESISSWQVEVDAVLKKLNDLLPEALTKGLSYAYSAQKVQEKAERFWHKVAFNIAIVGMIIVSSIPFIASMYSILVLNQTLDEALLKLPRLVLAIVPLYIPVLWIAYTSSKKINLSKRLIEEYSHKEALSKTYEGLSNQISGLDDSEVAKELKLKLLYNILEVSSENPGKLISDYNKADHPIMDALDKSVQLTSSIEKLARIPGFRKLASSLSEKAEKVLEVQAKKAEVGLDFVEEKTS